MPRWTDKSGFQYESAHTGNTNTWLTPPELVKALGPFDIDPCAAGAVMLSTCCHAEAEKDKIDGDIGVCRACKQPARFTLREYPRPWDLAPVNWTLADDGLAKAWPKEKRLFVNPPYGKHTSKWIRKCAEHGNSVMLIFARVETQGFFAAWNTADGMLFLPGRISFYDTDGNLSEGKPAANVLIAWGKANVIALIDSNIKGALVNRLVLPGLGVVGEKKIN